MAISRTLLEQSFRVNVPTASRPRRAPARGAGTLASRTTTTASESGRLRFALERQQDSEWCWAAVSVSLARYHNILPSGVTQCELASRLARVSCCPIGANRSWCNRPREVIDGFREVGISGQYMDGPASFDQVANRIRGHLPVVVQINWPHGGGSHLIVIYGFNNDPRQVSEPWVLIRDPLDEGANTPDGAYRYLPYQKVVTQYTRVGELNSDWGRWDFTFWAEPTP